MAGTQGSSAQRSTEYDGRWTGEEGGQKEEQYLSKWDKSIQYRQVFKPIRSRCTVPGTVTDVCYPPRDATLPWGRDHNHHQEC